MNQEFNGGYRIEDPKRGKVKIVFFSWILIAMLLFSFLVYFFTKANKGLSPESQPVAVTVDRGLSTSAIAAKLKVEKIIDSAWVFELYTRLNQAGSKMQAGEYILDRKMSIAEIVEILSAGKVVPSDRKITIPEGWTNKQIAEYLAARNIASANQFAKILKQTQSTFKFFEIAKPYDFQGFLFPDTYQIGKDEGGKELIERMLKNFESKITDEMVEDLKASNFPPKADPPLAEKLSDVIILASIVEKEVGRNLNQSLTPADLKLLQQERGLVASVFYNRLRRDMPLQSDATVNYVTGKFERQPSFEDLKVKSSYNTYAVSGLPPGPISNPGLGAIKAAIYPANSDYLYFLNKEDGEAVFSKTLEEHNANKEKFLN